MWEYNVISIRSMGEAQSILTQLGLEGWELVSIVDANGHSLVLFLKRPIKT